MLEHPSSRKLWILCALLLLLSSCSSPSAFQNYKGADAACIAGNALSPLEFAKGDASAFIEGVDGISTEGATLLATGEVCFPPGAHEVLIGLHHGRAIQAHAILQNNFEAGSRYKIKGRTHNRCSTIAIFQKYNGAESQVATIYATTEKMPLKQFLFGIQNGSSTAIRSSSCTS